MYKVMTVSLGGWEWGEGGEGHRATVTVHPITLKLALNFDKLKFR